MHKVNVKTEWSNFCWNSQKEELLWCFDDFQKETLLSKCLNSIKLTPQNKLFVFHTVYDVYTLNIVR